MLFGRKTSKNLKIQTKNMKNTNIHEDLCFRSRNVTLIQVSSNF